MLINPLQTLWRLGAHALKGPIDLQTTKFCFGRSQWLRGLRLWSAAARLLRLWVRIPPGGMDVSCECCVLSGRGLCYELITRPEESYWMWGVFVWDLETSWMRRPWPTRDCCAKNKVCFGMFWLRLRFPSCDSRFFGSLQWNMGIILLITKGDATGCNTYKFRLWKK